MAINRLDYRKVCVTGCGRWSQGRRYNGMCAQCFHKAGRPERQLAVWKQPNPLRRTDKSPDQPIRRVVIDGQEYDVMFDGT